MNNYTKHRLFSDNDENGSSGGAKIYKALITQVGLAAPTVIILQNTIGNIVWSYDSVGVYQGTLVGAFTTNKTFLPSLDQRAISETDLLWSSEDVIEINTFDSAGVLTDNALDGLSLEIQVYP